MTRIILLFSALLIVGCPTQGTPVPASITVTPAEAVVNNNSQPSQVTSTAATTIVMPVQTITLPTPQVTAVPVQDTVQ